MNIEKASNSVPPLHTAEANRGEPSSNSPRELLPEDVDEFFLSLEGLSDSEKTIRIAKFAAEQGYVSEGRIVGGGTTGSTLETILFQKTNLDEQAMDTLIEVGLGDLILLEPEKFVVQDPDTVIQKVTSGKHRVREDQLRNYLTNLSIYKGRTEPYAHETLQALIKNGYVDAVASLD